MTETLIAVHRDAESPVSGYVPEDLAYVLWGLERPLDIPTAIRKMSRRAREPRDRVARRVITNMPYLLRQGLARLEWERAPR